MGQDRVGGTGSAAKLTERERQVAVAIGQGTSTAAIARGLEISVRTVESHLLHAYRKLGVHNRVELVLWIVRGGTLDVNAGDSP